jgi:hypothetical protein
LALSQRSHHSNRSRRKTSIRIIVAAAALSLLASTSAYAAAKEALTEEQIEGVQTAIKAMGCTVEDTNRG